MVRPHQALAQFSCVLSLWMEHTFNILQHMCTRQASCQSQDKGPRLCRYAVAFLYGGELVRGGGYTAGTVVQIMTGIHIAGIALGQAAPDLPHYAAGRAAAARLMHVINRTPTGTAGTGSMGVVPATPMTGAVEIEGVAFAYPARPEVSVFTDLNLRIEAGQTVALVGASGCGKSTLIQLLQRFYDPSAGSIRVDGADIRELSLEWYRSNVRVPMHAAHVCAWVTDGFRIICHFFVCVHHDGGAAIVYVRSEYLLREHRYQFTSCRWAL